jgi:hypothetical protein
MSENMVDTRCVCYCCCFRGVAPAVCSAYGLRNASRRRPSIRQSGVTCAAFVPALGRLVLWWFRTAGCWYLTLPYFPQKKCYHGGNCLKFLPRRLRVRCAPFPESSPEVPVAVTPGGNLPSTNRDERQKLPNDLFLMRACVPMCLPGATTTDNSIQARQRGPAA